LEVRESKHKKELLILGLSEVEVDCYNKAMNLLYLLFIS